MTRLEQIESEIQRMTHRAAPGFWALYNSLPTHVKALAEKNFELLKTDLRHPSLHLKKAGRYWSVRVGLDHRALDVDIHGGVVWIWIGPYSAYDTLVT